MKAALVTFVKTPSLTPVKPKLAKTIGRQATDEFYKSCIHIIEQKMLQINAYSNDIHPYWAIAEQGGMDHKLWKNLNKIYTGEGDMGQRLHHVYSSLRIGYDYVIMMSIDSPHVPKSVIIQALDDLAANDFVIGSNHRGGFYLLGGSVGIQYEVWTNNTHYDTATTCMDLLRNIQTDHRKIATLPTYASVDDSNDLPRIQEEMQSINDNALNNIPLIVPPIASHVIEKELVN